MTPDEKALKALRMFYEITPLGDHLYDVRDREGKGWDGPLVKRWGEADKLAREALAEAPAPPPPPVVWREAVDGEGVRYRRRDGVWEFYSSAWGEWHAISHVSDDFALALARCVTEPTVGEGENADA